MPVNISDMWEGLGPQGRGAALGSLIGGGGLAALSALGGDEEESKWSKGLKGLAIGAPLGALVGGVGAHLSQPSVAPAATPSAAPAQPAAASSSSAGNPAHILTRAYKQMFPSLAALGSGQAAAPNQLGLWDYLRKREAGVGHDLQRMWRGIQGSVRRVDQDATDSLRGAVSAISPRTVTSGSTGLGTAALTHLLIRNQRPLASLQNFGLVNKLVGGRPFRVSPRVGRVGRLGLPALAGLLAGGAISRLPHRGDE